MKIPTVFVNLCGLRAWQLVSFSHQVLALFLPYLGGQQFIIKYLCQKAKHAGKKAGNLWRASNKLVIAETSDAALNEMHNYKLR